MRSSVPSQDTIEQIIKFGISNYLQLCVEAGFSQIQSHIHIHTVISKWHA